MDQSALEKKARDLRQNILDICVKGETGHVTSSFSCLDILVALYYGGILRFSPQNPKWDQRDRFLLSKGQASPALYAILADLGFYPPDHLEKFAQNGGKFGVHLQDNVPGVEITSGALGHGLGIGAGLALGAKLKRELFLTFVLLGDGECYEGSVWEAAMFASHHRLNNLVAIVDRNFLCATDFTENLIRLEPFDAKWDAFGWDVIRVNGHDIGEVLESLAGIRSRPSARPRVVIADTVKGAGIDFMCYNPLWHAVTPKGDEAAAAKACLQRNNNDE